MQRQREYVREFSVQGFVDFCKYDWDGSIAGAMRRLSNMPVNYLRGLCDVFKRKVHKINTLLDIFNSVSKSARAATYSKGEIKFRCNAYMDLVKRYRVILYCIGILLGEMWSDGRALRDLPPPRNSFLVPRTAVEALGEIR